MPESVRVTRGSPEQPGSKWCHESMLGSCLHRKLFAGIFVQCWVPLSFGYCKWETLSLYFLSFPFFFLSRQSFAPAIPFCLVAHYFAL